MKVGDRIKHRSRNDCGVGRVVQIYSDNTVDAQFSIGSFSGIPINTVISVEELLADHEND